MTTDFNHADNCLFTMASNLEKWFRFSLLLIKNYLILLPAGERLPFEPVRKRMRPTQQPPLR